ncbi:phage tail protein [Oxalobacter paraformigenes]|uniref:Phage tail collar domain-containing protein n=1 Tax=Oxalobacter paraformigenes TaxID=556268 RepID=C3X3G6_9BURK|nr:phage tail protein [Oxalobacter paraformigenes]EEO27752.1 hypothetical protein OFAG_00905 [Oxalobacter paraformigenes]
MARETETDWINTHRKPRSPGELREAFCQLRDCLKNLMDSDGTARQPAIPSEPDPRLSPQLLALLKENAMQGGTGENATPLPWLESLYPSRGENGVPPGSVLYLCSETPPDGWLVADGSMLLVAAYPDLFAAIGTAFGSGDNGMTTFRLPDLRGEFIRCLDKGRGLDDGRPLGSVQGDEIRNHNHGFLDIPKVQFGSGVYSWTPQVMEVAEHAPIATTWTGGSETRPRNIALTACIKY